MPQAFSHVVDYIQNKSHNLEEFQCWGVTKEEEIYQVIHIHVHVFLQSNEEHNCRINSWKRNQVLVNIVAADDLVLQHQTISSHNTDSIPITDDNFHERNFAFHLKIISKTEKWPSHLWVNQQIRLTAHPTDGLWQPLPFRAMVQCPQDSSRVYERQLPEKLYLNITQLITTTISSLNPLLSGTR